MAAPTTDMERAANARVRLARLARCEKIRPYQSNDEELVCANDGFELVGSPGGWQHSGREIAAMRALTYDGQWPQKGN